MGFSTVRDSCSVVGTIAIVVRLKRVESKISTLFLFSKGEITMNYPMFKTKKEWKDYFEELNNQGISVIDDLFQVEIMRDFILKKTGEMFYITNLTFTEKGNCLVSLLSVTPNRQYPFLHIQRDAVVLTTEGWARSVPSYCEELLNVEVEGTISLANLTKEIYKVGKGIDTHFVMQSDDGNYYDVISGTLISEEDIFDELGSPLDDVIVYNQKNSGGMTCTNGQLKRKNITLAANNLSNYDIDAVWNSVTYGCSDIICQNQKATPKEIAQINTRLSAFKAPSVAITDIKTFAVYMGKITYQMKKGGDEYNDGFGYLASEFLGKAFTSIDPEKYYFAPWACEGLTVQKRAWLNKIMAEVVNYNYINEMISHHLLETVILKRGMISEDDCKEFILGVNSKGKQGKFAGKVVIICDNYRESWKIDLFTDLNGLKAPFDINRPSGIEILDISHTEHDIETGSRTSTQLLQSLMVADPTATRKFIDRLGKEYLSIREERLTNDIGKVPSWADFQSDNCDYQQLLARIAPKFAHRYYAPLWHSLVDASVKGYVKACRRLNLPTKGAYAKIVIDSAADFGRRILSVNENHEVEIVAPVAERNDIKRLVGVKYPKQGTFEYLKGHVISRKEYAERVEEDIHLTDIQKRLLINHVNKLSGGAVMIPAIEDLKALLAGMDVDGDAIQLFFDEELVDITWKIEPKAVLINQNDITTYDVYEEVDKAS